MPENSVVIEFHPCGQNSLWFKVSFDKSNSGSKGHHLNYFLLKTPPNTCETNLESFNNDGIIEINSLKEIVDSVIL